MHLKTAIAYATLALPASAETLSPFVEANAIHTMFHEIGHALIDQFQLPVIGQEEDAVDAFATIEVVNFFEEDAKAILIDVARAWLWSDAQTDREDLDFYDIHDLDAQRAYRTICHLYGLDPEANIDAAEWAELPEDTLATCEETGPLAFESWEALLEDGVLLDENGAQTQVDVIYDPASVHTELRETLIASKLLDDMAYYAQVNFDWPEPIEIKAEECGEANAFWDPETRTAILCYEILAEWADMEAAL